MRFGSELLRKAEQIFTIIYQAPMQLVCFPSSGRCLGWSKVREIALGDELSGCGVTHHQTEKEKRGGSSHKFWVLQDKFPAE